MSLRDFAVLTVVLVLSSALETSASEGQQGAPMAPLRVGLYGGMGVSYVNPTDIADLVNSTPGTLERVPEFKTGVEFYGGFSIPLAEDWGVKAEYAYLLGSYNLTSVFGPAEYTFVTHMPSVIAQYIVVAESVYNVKVGFGGGYHFGSLTQRFGNLEDTFSGSGPGVIADLEANTALGESLFAYLGVIIRWEFISELTNANGKSPSATTGSSPTTLNFFGIGARLGFSYYF